MRYAESCASFSFNGRRGFIYDEENDDEIYFEAKSVLNQSKPIVSGKTRVLYFPDPADDAKALFVYSECEESSTFTQSTIRLTCLPTAESSYISSLKMQGLPRLQHAYPSPTSEPEEDPFDLQAAYAASVDYLAQRHGKTLVNNKPALSRANTITASSGSKSSVPPPLPPNKPTHAPGQPNAKVQAEAARLAAIAREREERQNYGAPIEVAYCKLTKTQSAPELSGSAAASQIEEPIRRSTSWASFRPTQRRKYKFNPGNDDPFAGSEGFENLPPPTLHRRKKHDKVQQHQAEQVEIKHVENIYAPTEKTSFVQLPTIIEQPSYFDYSVPQRCETPTVEGMKRSLISQFPKPAPKFRLADRRRGKDLKNHILQLFPE